MTKYKVEKSKNKEKTIISKKYWKNVQVNPNEMWILENVPISGIADVQMEGRKKLVYTVPKSVSLSEYVTSNMTIHKFYNVIIQIVEQVKRVKINRLRVQNVLLNSKYIFVKEITGELFFVYEPLMEEQEQTNENLFFSSLLKEVKCEDKQLSAECQLFDAFLKNNKNVNIAGIEQYVEKRYPQIFQQISKIDVIERKQSHAKEKDTKVSQVEKEQNLKAIACRRKVNKRIVSLVHTEKESQVQILHSPFSIGKSAENDLVIDDNKSISRTHAQIYSEDGIYYLKDLNSTNGTFINDKRLKSEEVIEVHPKDVIRFANEEYMFHMNG